MAFEIVAAAVLVAGLVFSAVLSIRTWTRTRNGTATYKVLRQSFGGAILLGLEILVAGDLIRTVAIAPTLVDGVTPGSTIAQPRRRASRRSSRSGFTTRGRPTISSTGRSVIESV